MPAAIASWWSRPVLFAAVSGDSWVGWTVLAVLYAMIFLAVFINREEHGRIQQGGLLLPSGEVIPFFDTSAHRPADGNESALQRSTVWEFRLSELPWWQIIGLLAALASLGYGVGLVIFAQIRPDSTASLATAPYALVNAILLFLALTYATPPSQTGHSAPAGTPIKPSRTKKLREVFPMRLETWNPDTTTIDGNIKEYTPGTKLTYERHTDPLPSPQEAMIPSLPLFVTLFLSIFIAPLITGVTLGALYLVNAFDVRWFVPFFAWSSGALTLLMAWLSYTFLKRAAISQANREQTKEFGHFVLDFEQQNAYASNPTTTQSFHFKQCHTLLVSFPQEDEETTSESKTLCVYLYGQDLPEQGLLLAAFSPQPHEEHYTDCMRFAGTLATEMELPLFATNQTPIVT